MYWTRNEAISRDSIFHVVDCSLNWSKSSLLSPQVMSTAGQTFWEEQGLCSPAVLGSTSSSPISYVIGGRLQSEPWFTCLIQNGGK